MTYTSQQGVLGALDTYVVRAWEAVEAAVLDGGVLQGQPQAHHGGGLCVQVRGVLVGDDLSPCVGVLRSHPPAQMLAGAAARALKAAKWSARLAGRSSILIIFESLFLCAGTRGPGEG